MKETIRGLTSQAIVSSGMSRLVRQLASREGTIVFYGHRVEDNDEGMLAGLSPHYFREQLRYICAHFEVIPLLTLFAALCEGRPVPNRAAVLTFDDGFRDNYTNAFPILQEFGVPATIFVVTDSLTDGRLPWAQQIGYMLQNTSRDWLRLRPDLHFDLATPKQRSVAFHALQRHLAPFTSGQREEVLQSLRESLAVTPPADRMMTWEQADEMVRAGHEIGAHTMTHALLGVVPPDEARREIIGSRDAVRDRLGTKLPSFCFPGGVLTEELTNFVANSKFAGSFLPEQPIRYNTAENVTPFTVSRTGLPEAPARNLEAEIDGPFPLLRRLMRRSGI